MDVIAVWVDDWDWLILSIAAAVAMGWFVQATHWAQDD